MENRRTLFVDVVLPVAVPNLFTYRVPMELNEYVQVGQRVVVQFGKQKLYTALIRNIHEEAPKNYTAKYLDSLLDETPVVTEFQFRLWEWMSNYYCCTTGEVMFAALPGSMRLGSETKIILAAEWQEEHLTDKELIITDALQAREVLTLTEISELLQIKSVQPYINSLLKKGAIQVEEELRFKYKPKFKTVIELTPEFEREEALKNLFTQLENDKRAEKQINVLLQYIQLSRQFSDKKVDVTKSELVKVLDGNASPIETLVKKKVFQTRQVRVDRLFTGELETIGTYELAEFQQNALDEIRQQFEEKDTVLLHGVTGSGKTEIYIKLIESVIAEGKQVLYLLPEIALTAQIVNRLRKFFGQQVGIYHSKFNEHERAEIWAKTLKGEYKVVLGARSSLFMPFQQLGLIIVDEEHENSFKQFDPAPRYNARDSAIVLASLFKAKVLLGSATPAIETFHNAQEGKFGFVQLKKRFGGVMMPEIQCIDIQKATRRKEMHHTFSHDLLEHIKAALDKQEQIILFQNRRGYAPQWACETCNWVPRCKQCDVSLTYHKFTNQLQCHYCSTVYPTPKVCGACGSNKLKMVGFGTEKIEEDLAELIPGIRISRMDLDSTRSKNAYLNIINDFEDRQVDVLVGTQMVTKGLDFDNVALVGILNADAMLNFPDFRSFERSFQLLTQVAGRAGRKNKRGKVFIQTYNPNHWVIQKVMENDYEGLFRQEIIERRNFFYPPFVRLIKITLRHKDRLVVREGADHLAKELRQKLGKRVLGPEEPVISRIRNYYYRTILIKFEKGTAFNQLKTLMLEQTAEFNIHKEYKKIILDIDVDPQ